MSNWHYARGGEKDGPITMEQLKELATTGQLSPDDLVWREDMKDWRKASTVKGLFPEATPSVMTPATPMVAKYTILGCGGSLMLLLICTGVLTMIAKTVDPEGFANVQAGKNRDGSERNAPALTRNDTPSTPSSPAQTRPVELGTLEEMGEEAFHDLPFANVDRSPDIDAVPLSEAFAQAGTFRFRNITPDIAKATMTRQEWEEMTVLGYKERTVVREGDETFDIRISDGEPKNMIQWEGTPPGLVSAYPIIRIDARPGDRWEWTNHDVAGNKVISRYHYRRCVPSNGVPCVMIETGLFSEGGRQTLKTVEWYAEGIGLVKQSEYQPFSSGMALVNTKHRIIGE